MELFPLIFSGCKSFKVLQYWGLVDNREQKKIQERNPSILLGKKTEQFVLIYRYRVASDVG